MGKVNKRQRKFLSKKVLPHRKKGGVRRDNNKSKGNNSKGGDEDASAPAAGEQRRKTLPEGLDTTAFLECAWLNREACAATGVDACVAPFEPDVALLEGTTSKPTKHGKGVKGSSASSWLNTARAMIGQAVDEESIDDLLRVVWALQAAAAAAAASASAARNSTTASTSPLSDSSSAGQGLRADPSCSDEEAVKVLRGEALSRLHLAFRAHLGPKREEGASKEEWEDAVRAHRQQLERAEAWPKLGGALLSFLTLALDHMEIEMETPISDADGSTSRGNGKSSSSSSSSSSKQEGSDTAVPAAALVEGLTRMQHHVSLLLPFPRLARRYLAFLLGVLRTTDDTAALSLAFVRLYELSTSQPMPFLHDAFKGSYRCYRAAAERIGAGGKGAAGAAGSGSVVGVKARSGGSGGAGSLPLLRECLAELFGVEKPSAYLHAYVYIHDLAREALAAAAEVQKGGGKPREAGSALRRLRSWDFLQSLLLWTSVVAAHPAKSSLGPLVPPLTKTLEITFQLSPGLYGAPRTLALARAAQDLAAASGVFLPTSHHLVGLLELLHAREGRPCPTSTATVGNPEGGGSSQMGREVEQGAVVASKGGSSASKKRGRGGGAAAAAAAAATAVAMAVDLSAVAGLGKEDLKLGDVHTAVSRGAASLIAREAVCYRWSAGLPELCAGTGARLGRLLDGGCLTADGGAGRCRARVRALQVSLGKAAAETVARRARGSKHPGEAGPVDTFRSMEESTATQRLQVFKETS